MKILLSMLIAMFILQSCSTSEILQSNNHEEKLKELDKVFGYCNNPHRQIGNKSQKKICESKERAAGPDGEIGDPMNISDIFGGNNQTIIAGSAVNKYLWDASLKTLDAYPMKNIDFEGGYMETDWIYEKDVKNQRCLIKAHVLSQELISTGVETKLVCQEMIEEKWYSSDKDYREDEKKLTLQILKEASILSKQT